MSREWEESLEAVVQDSYFKDLTSLMDKYIIVTDQRNGYEKEGNRVVLSKLESYIARHIKTLYLGLVEYYINTNNTIFRMKKGDVWPSFYIKYDDKVFRLEKENSTTVISSIDKKAYSSIDTDSIINIKDVQDYYHKLDCEQNKKRSCKVKRKGNNT